MADALPPGILRIPRDSFIADRWDYKPGEHVSWIGYTGSGKTTFMRQLLRVSATPKLPAVVLAVKPRDENMVKLGREVTLKTTRSWPPVSIGWEGRHNGYVLWPRHTFDPDVDEAAHRKVFRTAILDSYRRGKRILVADECLTITQELNLPRELVTVWTKGRVMKCGLWAGTQKPSHVPLWMYSQAQHLFVTADPDRRARKRLAEIGGGIDPALIEECMRHLGPYEWIYVRPKDRRVCIVGA